MRIEKMSSSKRRRSRQQCIVPLLMGAFRRSMGSSSSSSDDIETGWPTDVHHITHVTFDRFHGFLGLPLELQLEFPGRVPSASVSVFGVSTQSMQCSYDSRGNSIPTILLLMQERLYSQGGLQAEGIFRINPENSEEEKVRGYLNRGIVPEEMDVHCLAGLIKAWFRELPCGVLDGLCPQQVLECKTDQQYIDLVNQLNPTESALLNWAVHLMADVVEHQNLNKMNSRNIAMVFAPNMTQMSDPLTALMHAVQVMNLLNTLINKTLTHRQQMGASGYSSDEDEEMESQQEMETSSGEDECFLYSVQPQDLMQEGEESAMSITDDDNESTSADSCFTSPYQENFTITPAMSSG